MQHWDNKMKKITNKVKNWLISQLYHFASQRISKYQNKKQNKSHQKSLEMNWLHSPYKLHLLHIPLLLQQRDWNRWGGTYNKHQKSPHQNTLKMKWLLSPLKPYLLKITLRPDYKPSLLHLIKVSKNKNNNWYSSREKTHTE